MNRTFPLMAALLGSTAILRMTPDGPSSSEAGAGAAVQSMSLVDALNSLDPDNDAHWTADGLPDVDVIESLTGNKWVSRGDIEGFPIDRATASASKAAAVPLVPPDLPDPAPPADVPVDPPADPATPPDVTPPDVPPVDQAPPPDAPPTPPADPVPATPPVAPAPSQPPQPISVCRLVMLTFGGGATFDDGTSAVGLVVKVLDDGSVNVKTFSPDGGPDGFFTGVRNTDDVAAMPDGPEKNGALACTWSWPPRV